MFTFFRSIIFFLLIAVHSSGEAAALRALLVCDTDSGDIQSALYKDLSNMHEEVERISVNTELALAETVLIGADLSGEKLDQAIRSLKVAKEDALLFYFSGHGYRTGKKEGNPWPYLYFSAEGIGVDFERVVSRLAAKGARLVVGMADCCNNLIPDSWAPFEYPLLFEKGGSNRQMLNYRKLFREGSGVVMICSSEAGEYSWCHSQGGLFTLSFLKQLKRAVNGKDEVSWERLFAEVSKDVKGYQTPYFRLELY